MRAYCATPDWPQALSGSNSLQHHEGRLLAPSPANLAAAKAVIAALGREPLTVAGDLRTLEGCSNVFTRVSERFGRCDVLVNNAGATRAGAFVDLADDAWLDGYALKFFGAVRLSRLLWPLLKASQGARRTPSS